MWILVSLAPLGQIFSKAAQMEFAAFIDVLLPPEPAWGAKVYNTLIVHDALYTFRDLLSNKTCLMRRIYAADFKHGTCYLRPFMVGWRKDFGLSGMSDPDTFLALVELVLSEGCLVICLDKFYYCFLVFPCLF